MNIAMLKTMPNRNPSPARRNSINNQEAQA